MVEAQCVSGFWVFLEVDDGNGGSVSAVFSKAKGVDLRDHVLNQLVTYVSEVTVYSGMEGGAG